jgi:hypothetical protein
MRTARPDGPGVAGGAGRPDGCLCPVATGHHGRRRGRSGSRLIPATQSSAQQHRGCWVRCALEAAWSGRSAAELCEAAWHQALSNMAFTATAISLLCVYDADLLAPEVIASVERTHPAVVVNREGIAEFDHFGSQKYSAVRP